MSSTCSKPRTRGSCCLRASGRRPWDDLFGELARRAAPLLDAGWELVSTEREDSWEFGDSVFWDLERDGVCIELEY